MTNRFSTSSINVKRLISGMDQMMRNISDYNMEYGTAEDQTIRDQLNAELGMEQQEGYIGRTYPTVILDAVTKNYRIAYLKYYEPVDLLPGVENIVPVYISGPVMQELNREGESAFYKLAVWVDAQMQGTKYKHFIVPRKGKLFFSSIPANEHPIFKHFVQYAELYRNELLGVICGARGFTFRDGEIDTPEIIVSEVADGVQMLLTKTEGEDFGLAPGIYQDRGVYPFSKGLTIVWHNDNVKSFFNSDVLKLKKKTKNGVVMEPIPSTLKSDDRVIIGTGHRKYEIRYTHQAGYMSSNTIKSKKGPWGDVPKLIANTIVKTIKERQTVSIDGYQLRPMAIEEALPDYIRFLQARGLPKQYLMTLQQIQEHSTRRDEEEKFKTSGRDLVESILLAARPVVGSMCMFACLPAERVGMKPGWYKPTLLDELITDHIGRVPFMAVGGGIQKIKWVGNSPTELGEVILAVVSEDRSDDVSKKVWEEIQAMGADSDGDRLIIFSEQGLRMIKSTGLVIERNPEGFKAKNPYPGVSDWTKEDLIKFWSMSTPRAGQIGKGDTITRDARDLYKAGVISEELWVRFARYGAGEVQVGVSAPKYFFVNPNRRLLPFNAMTVRELMTNKGVGQGRKMYGLLWDEARVKAEKLLSEYLPDKPEIVNIDSKHEGRRWKEGYSKFHNELQEFSPELGTDWPTFVRRAFFRMLRDTEGYGAEIFRAPLKADTAIRIRKLIIRYIKDYPHRQNVWCWMLDEKYTGIEKDQILRVIGLPWEKKVEVE